MTPTTSNNHQHQADYDVVIIGAGIVGSMIARELCRYEGRFALLEKEPFSGFGVSKANPSMLHSPLMFPTGPLRTKLSHNAAARYQKLANELDVVFKTVDEIFLAFDSSQLDKLKTAQAWADANQVSAGHVIISAEKIREIEANASKKAIGALYGKAVSGGIYATEWTFALTENAVQNGLALYLHSPVTDIEYKDEFDFEVITPRGRIKTRYIINAAGLFVDEIARMVGDSDIQLALTKGAMLILDKSASKFVRNMIYGSFGRDHSELVTPTAHGNLLIGLGYFTTPAHKGDTAVSRDKLQEVLRMGKKLVPAISEKDIITAFAGIRSENNKAAGGDFYIEHSKTAPGVIHAAIGSPGLTAAPTIAEYVVNLAADAGLRLEEKESFNPHRIGWRRFETATATEKHRLIASNSKYGHIVCRCELVSEAEVLEAIRRGADTMDAVKHVTRAGMGRCQGGFCGISVLNYLSKTQGLGPNQVTKKGCGSYQITA
ncbi:MAG: FAD-dependent oxidoreductase [Desulfobacterales bacterium]|nr:FAD-dependent oxidoreductase [Desulfobacterales bacterium]